jgi:ABC-2 type transport system permease protein
MSTLASVRNATRAMPTLLRVGMAESLAYRAEFIIWMLTATLPLVMLGLWTSVAADAPFANYGESDFVAYYLATLIVRNMTGNWAFWHISEEIRQGTLSMRLLRPIHPFAAYAATHLASVPLRSLVAVPFGTVLLLSNAGDLIATDAAVLATFVLALVGAWILSFFVLCTIGALSFFIEKSMAVFDVYMGVFAVLSGYLIPLALLPPWVRDVADWAPFRYMLSFPVELLLGQHDAASAWRHLGVQWAYVVAAVLVATTVWRAGVRRYEAYGA